MKDIRLLQGNCLEVMNDIQDKSIDAIITDLPFGQTARNACDIVILFNDYIILEVRKKPRVFYKDDFLLWSYQQGKADYNDALAYFEENKSIGLWTHYKRIIKDNGAIILFANGMFTADLMESNREMWKYNLVWEKTQPTGFQNVNRMPMRNHEDMCVFYKKQPTYNPQKTSGHIRKVSTAAHKGETVLDSTAGSMTTGVAAIRTGRKCICIENDEKIFDIGKNRIMKCVKERNSI